MSSRIPSEYGAIRMLAANHKTPNESSQREIGLLPRTSRTKTAIANGSSAVATRVYGLRSINTFPGDPTGV